MAKSVIIKHNVCVHCSHSFVVTDFSNPRNSRCPINLECGHSVCELCFRTYMRPKTGITCTVCHTVTLPKGDSPDDICDEFNFNMYLMGHMVATQGKRIFTDKDINFMPAGASFRQLKKKTDNRGSSELCAECSVSNSVYHCEQCVGNYCQLCWKVIHSRGKVLKQHVSIPYNKFKKSNSLQKLCSKHNRPTEYYCCSEAICSDCIVNNHQGHCHNPIHLKNQNLQCLDLLNASAEQARLRLLRLKQTLKKTRSEICTSGTEKSKHTLLEQKLARYFGHLHGLLQVVEEKAMSEVTKARTVRERSLENVQLELENNIELISSLLNEVEGSMEPANLNNMDYTNLCQRLMEAKDVPCFLVHPKNDAPDPTLELNEEMKEAIVNCCKLFIPPEVGYKLHSEQDLPENYEIEPLQQGDFTFLSEKQSAAERLAAAFKTHEASRVRSISGTQFSSTSSNGSLNSSYTELKQRIEIAENESYHVYISYLKNASEFYVNLNMYHPRVKSIEKWAAKFLTMKNVTPEAAVKDELYLVQYKRDSNWYRGRVEKIVDDGSRGEENIFVYYVDYGNREYVSLSRLRCISDKLREEPFLAHRCKIFDCVPKGGKWSKESTQAMLNLLEKALVTMYVMKINSEGILEVDLCKTSADENMGHEISSLRDTLMFLEFANLVEGWKKPTYNSAGKNYLFQNLPRDGEEFIGVVGHSVSPNEFYVQKWGLESQYLLRLMDNMDFYYRNHVNMEVILNPIIGMPCAAQFSCDNKWYRATVVDFAGNKNVVVYYVDYGNKETISYTKIRMLHEQFFKLVPQAIKCSLSQIKPISKNGWNQSAKKFFTKYVDGKNFITAVDGRDKHGLRVLMYENTDEKKVCLNAVLVENKMALGVGPQALKPSETYKSDIKKAGKSKLKRLTTNGLTKMSSQAKKRLSAEQLRAKHVSQTQDESSDSDSEIVVESTDKLDDGVIRIEIKVLVLQSPSFLYVQVLDYAPKLRQLQKELKKYYKNTKADETRQWKVDDRCAVLNLEKKKWSRGIIHEFIHDERVKVFLKDFAQIEEVPISYIRPLEDQFLKLPVAAVKCHLAGVKPAGQDWPSISCEFLASEIENYSHIYFTKMGDIEDNSLPIELWVKKVTPGGALEPTREEWLTLNQSLVDQGLAIPVKTPNFTVDVQSLDFSCDFNINKIDDSEKQIWKTQKEIRKPETLESEGSDIESDVTDPGSSVSAQGSNYSASFIPSVLSDWLPAKNIEKVEFMGMPTYVDTDGVIYIYDIEDDEPKINRIRDTLLAVYANSKPTPDDQFWTNGQLCIVRYHLDNNWYRGKVLNVNADLTYEVLFVDYGNVETCQVADMRKSIKMIQMPVLTHKFLLSGVAPNSDDGNWPSASIDFLHGLVVEKESKVVVEEESFDPNLPSKIRLFIGKVDVATFLIEKKHAVVDTNESEETDSVTCTDKDVIIDDEIPQKIEQEEGDKSVLVEPPVKCEIKEWSAIVEEEHRAEIKLKKTAKCLKAETLKAEIETKKKEKKVRLVDKPKEKDLSFKNWELPLTLNWFQIESQMLVGATEFIAHIVDDETLPMNVRKALTKFNNLCEEIQKDGSNQPELKHFKKGTPCISLYSETGDWYRAVIERFHPENDSLIQVNYVDYGNKEYVDKKNIRVCKEEWFNVPKQSLRLKLYNMEKCRDAPKDVYTKTLQKCLLCNTDLVVNIVIRHETYFEVEVLSAIKGPLVYQKMIDENLMKPIVKSDEDSDKENEN